MKKISLLLLPLFLLSACGAAINPADDVAGGAIDNAGCKNTESRVWNSLYKTAENGLELPTPEEVKASFFKKGKKRGFKKDALEKYAEEFTKQYRAIYESADKGKDSQALISSLVALETGDREGATLALAQDTIGKLRGQVQAAEANLEATCENPEDPADEPNEDPNVDPEVPAPPPANSDAEGALFTQLKANLKTEVYGARKTITTAYQSCETLKLRPLTAADPDVKGIKITGNHSSGTGKIRVISSVRDVQKTHYYLANTRPQSGSACADIMASPLIYDFGGKPMASASKPTKLNLFQNGGSGSAALGIDCSGYIFTSLAVAGLKLDPAVEMKAVQVNNIPARRYMKPSEGMRCFSAPAMTSSLSIRAGDIAATTGHIIMVDEVGSDPLGISRINKVSDCTEANLSSESFNFVISQSDPSKAGIGINRMQARDYLRGGGSFTTGFQKVAVAACKAKFGSTTTPALTNMALVRHKGTSECKTKAFTLEHESCLYSCPRI